MLNISMADKLAIYISLNKKVQNLRFGLFLWD